MNSNTWAMLCHLGGLVGYLGNGIGSIIAPVILWAIKKDEFPDVDEHGKEAVNFNISVLIYSIVLAILIVPTFGLSIIALLALAVFHVVMCVLASIKANNGEFYRYPLTIRFVK